MDPKDKTENSLRGRFNLKSQFTDPTGNPMQALLTVMKSMKIADPKALLLPWVEDSLSGPIEFEDIQIKNRVYLK